LLVRIADDIDLTQNHVAVVVQKTLNYIANELSSGRRIELRNFGIFEVKFCKGRNPNKPKNEIIITELAIVKFRAGKELKIRVDKLNSSRM
jgi:nucleoid DNA-binding protein